MRGLVRASTRQLITLVVAAAMVTLTAPTAGVAPTPGERAAALPACGELQSGGQGDGVVVSPWRAEIDDDGVITGHRLKLRHRGLERTLRAGRRGFAVKVRADRLLIGERDASGTRLDMIDPGHGCRLWSRTLEAHAYPDRQRDDGRVRLTVHDRDSRAYLGERLLDGDSGATEASTEEVCLESCYPNDGAFGAAALEPAGVGRPTPNFAAGGWAKDRTLAFRWSSGAVPPSWAKAPLKNAAADARRTADARSPRFPLSSSAANGISYTATLPGFCSSRAIACAGRSLPSTWGVWLRPHGTDYAWGTLRWCQKNSSSSGCFDIRRVALHELGHIVGLDHPSASGFSLSSSDSIMQGITPARPHAGASRHAFGRCDVATLQELYDTPDNKTAISTCNDVVTQLTLTTSRDTVARGKSVTLTARLKVDARAAYRQLSGNVLNGRSLKLKYRPAGSDGAWKTAWMRSLYSSGRYEISLKPSATWEFKAVFPAPTDEGLRYSRSAVRKVKVID